MIVTTSTILRPMVGAGLVLLGMAIAAASLYPSLQISGVGDGVDLGFHGLAYGVLVVFGAILWRQLAWVAAGAFAYSVLIEALQYFVPGREVHVSDIVANAIGVALGLVVAGLWRWVGPRL